MNSSAAPARTIRAGMVVRGDRVWLPVGTRREPVRVTRATGGYRRCDEGRPDEERQRRCIEGRVLGTGTARTWRRPFAEELEVFALVTD